MKRTFLACVTVALIAVPQIADARNLQCPPRWGKLGQPLVATKTTAKTIFLAVEKDFFPQADRVKFPDVDVTDDGNYWSVSRGAHVRIRQDGTMVSSVGGGQLSFRIDKCDGKIWYVFLTK
jgi:hypothetical protein